MRSLLFALCLLGAPLAAQAQFTVLDDNRSIDAEALVQRAYGLSNEIEERSANDVFFDVSVLSDAEVGASMGAAGASQTSTASAMTIGGFGGATASATIAEMPLDTIDAFSASTYQIDFGVTEAGLYEVAGSLFTTATGTGSSSASFVLAVVGGATLVSSGPVMDGDDLEFGTAIDLMPGTVYRLIVVAEADATEGGGTASADWDFNLAAAAPEPATLALLALALAGLAASRRAGA